MKTVPTSAAALVALLAIACAHAPGPETRASPAAPATFSGTPSLEAPMRALGFMRGVWAGPASGTNPDGTVFHVWQTERMGPMLGGDVVVIEGRGARDDGTLGFHAFAVVSWDARARAYEIRSYAMGRTGTFPLTATADGYVWSVPAGPGSTLRYTAVVKDGTWHEVGELVTDGRAPVKTFEMTLRRVGDTDWPAGGAPGPRTGRAAP